MKCGRDLRVLPHGRKKLMHIRMGLPRLIGSTERGKTMVSLEVGNLKSFRKERRSKIRSLEVVLKGMIRHEQICRGKWLPVHLPTLEPSYICKGFAKKGGGIQSRRGVRYVDVDEDDAGMVRRLSKCLVKPAAKAEVAYRFAGAIVRVALLCLD
jgi:hypothetical protein